MERERAEQQHPVVDFITHLTEGKNREREKRFSMLRKDSKSLSHLWSIQDRAGTVSDLLIEVEEVVGLVNEEDLEG